VAAKQSRAAVRGQDADGVATVRPIEGRTSRERQEWGRGVRAAVPHESLASVAPSGVRPDAVAILEEQAATRVPGLVPLRYARMLASPFAFLRGSAAVMAADLGRTPSTGITVQLCGDAHVSNFGVFATPERNLVFDLNDFDETHAGPFEWDVKRLAASIVVAGRDRGYTTSETARALKAALESYQRSIWDAAEMTIIDAWYHRIDVESIFAAVEAQSSGRGRQKAVARERRRVATEAQKRTSLGSLGKLAELADDGTWRLRTMPPLITRYGVTDEVREQIRDLFEQYAASLRREMHVLLDAYRPIDFARKVVGVGSVGTEAFVFLLASPHERDVLFLQLKQAQPSVLARWVDAPAVVSTRPIEHDGERVVVGQRLMQTASDQFLGWASGGREGAQHFYLRQLRDMKLSADITAMGPDPFLAYVALCARTLAFAHARSGSASAIAGYIGHGSAFRKAIGAWAVAYADRTVEDHRALADAAASGRVTSADTTLE
jgi:uncharacterized protein (DUF2252 family)